MEPFLQLKGIAAPLPLANIDTDKIIPARFMKTIKRSGLGRDLFHAMRYTHGQENPDFVLNRPPYREARILVTLDNFGCGSSREHAPWALLDFGIRCIVAPSFADIFHANCFKNGILPITMSRAECDTLMEDARDPSRNVLTIDLVAQTVLRADHSAMTFTTEALRRQRLMEGVDDISLTLQHAAQITEFERQRALDSWLYPSVDVTTLG